VHGRVLVVAVVTVSRRGVGEGHGVTRRDRNDVMANAALIVLGALAVVDNVVFHWLLAFHRFKQGWPGSIYVEVLLVVIGAVMVTLGFVRERRTRQRL
jgi:uncharacterized membrane protein